MELGTGDGFHGQIEISPIVVNGSSGGGDGTYMLWVNSTTLESPPVLPGLRFPPCPSFSYKRIAAAILPGAKSFGFFVYNQINDTAFAEHTYDLQNASWIVPQEVSVMAS